MRNSQTREWFDRQMNAFMAFQVVIAVESTWCIYILLSVTLMHYLVVGHTGSLVKIRWVQSLMEDRRDTEWMISGP